MVGPIVFVTLVVIQGVLQPDYSHIAMPVSALAAWPAGWLQNVNFFVAATLNAAFTIGLHHAIRPAPFGLAGIVLLLAGCVGLVGAGLFPWINVNGVPTETPSHVAAAVLSFTGPATGLIVLSRRMTADARWRDLSAYVLVTGVVMIVLFVAVGLFAIGDGTPLHRWAGLLQRILVAVWFACLFVLALRLMRVAREG